MKPLAKFDLDEAHAMIHWLVARAGGRVTVPVDDKFWDSNFPMDTKLIIDHDEDGNPVLVSER